MKLQLYKVEKGKKNKRCKYRANRENRTYILHPELGISKNERCKYAIKGKFYTRSLSSLHPFLLKNQNSNHNGVFL